MGISHYLAIGAEEIADPAHLPEQTAWMFCPFSKDEMQPQIRLPKDSLLILTDAVPPSQTDWEGLSYWIHTEKPKAVLLDFQRPSDKIGADFAEFLINNLSCSVCLSQGYAATFPGPVFLDPVPLHCSLEAHLAPWKGRELWLDISPAGERIILTRSGASFEELHQEKFPEAGFREEKLYCHYSIQMQEDAAEFTLWRTREDLEVMLEKARSMGVTQVVGLYQEWQHNFW